MGWEGHRVGNIRESLLKYAYKEKTCMCATAKDSNETYQLQISNTLISVTQPC